MEEQGQQQDVDSRSAEIHYGTENDHFRTKGVLTKAMVLTIYSTRTNDKRKKTAKSEEVAKEFGVTAKAIRDIWNRRTWWNVTRVLWTEEERLHHERTWKPSARLPGRPRGSKDSKPRKTRKKACQSEPSEGVSSSSTKRTGGIRRRSTEAPPDRIAGEDEISEFESDEEQDDDDEENSDCESTDDCDIEADARDGGISSSTADCATHSQHLKFRSRQLSMDDLFEEALKHVVQR